MQSKGFFKWTLLVTCIVILTSCMNESNETSNDPQEKQLIKMPKALFVHSFFDIYDDVYVMSYIDEEGNIYTALRNTPRRMIDIYDDIELSKDKITGQVDKEQLQEMYQLLLQVPIESGERENLVDFDRGIDEEMGRHTWSGVRYNSKEELEIIWLDQHGVSGSRNDNEKAKEISEWLREILYTEG